MLWVGMMRRTNRDFEYEITESGVEILRCFAFGGKGAVIEIPEKIEGEAVTAVGAYAFSPQQTPGGDRIGEVILPRGVVKIGRYAFYNCRELTRLEFPGGLRDVGAGAFTGCHRVRALTLRMEGEETSCLREILMELPEEIHVTYLSDRGEARLVFPEFFEEGVENTPARIIVTHLHGSGMQYRNCFAQRKLQLTEYDKCFALARAQEEERLLTELCFGRLLYPLELSENARKQYTGFLREHLRAAARYALSGQEQHALRMLLGEVRPEEEELPVLLSEAQRAGDAQAVGRIQEYRRERFGGSFQKKADVRSRFSL